MARALFETGCAASTAIEVELVTLTWPELDDCVFGARAEAAVTFEAVAAGQASARLEQGIGFRQVLHDFIEAGLAIVNRQPLLLNLRCCSAIPKLQLVMTDDSVAGRTCVLATFQEGIDMASCMLAMTNGNSD